MDNETTRNYTSDAYNLHSYNAIRPELVWDLGISEEDHIQLTRRQRRWRQFRYWFLYTRPHLYVRICRPSDWNEPGTIW